jgi:hypothetical protein
MLTTCIELVMYLEINFFLYIVKEINSVFYPKMCIVLFFQDWKKTPQVETHCWKVTGPSLKIIIESNRIQESRRMRMLLLLLYDVSYHKTKNNNWGYIDGGPLMTQWLNVLKLLRFDGFTAVTMKNPVFWDTEIQFIPHRGHITSPLQRLAS